MICIADDCKNEFTPKTHNQKYCSDECCRRATNQKLKDQYYEKKARLAGVEFRCKSKGCNNILSRYTADKICSTCLSNQESKKKNDIIGMLRNSGLA